MPGFGSNRFDWYSPKADHHARSSLTAILAGFSSVQLPHSVGQHAINEVSSLLGRIGVRLRALTVGNEDLTPDFTATLQSMATRRAGSTRLRCLVLDSCAWKPGAMAGLAPAMLPAGRAGCLTELHLHNARCITIGDIGMLRDVLVDSRCSIETLCLSGTLGLRS